MPPAVWNVLVTDGARSWVELRSDGYTWVRGDLTRAELTDALHQLARAYYHLLPKDPNATN